MNNDTHDELVKAYLEYYKANEKWERSRSYRTYYATQRWLRKIRRLAKAKGEENKEYFYKHVGTRNGEGKD